MTGGQDVLRALEFVREARDAVFPLVNQGEDRVWRPVSRACDRLDKADERLRAALAAPHDTPGAVSEQIAESANCSEQPTPAAVSGGEGMRECELRQRFEEAVGELPWIAARLAKGQQFNAYDSAENDEDCDDEDRRMHVGIGPITDFRFIATIEGGAQSRLIEAALKLTALARDAAGVDGGASVVVPPAASSGQDLRARVDAEIARITGWHPAKALLEEIRPLLALLSAPAVQPGGDLELEWLGDRDNLILANGTQADGWWEVRRGSVKGEVRGRGPTPGKALRAAMLAPATPLPEAEEGA